MPEYIISLNFIKVSDVRGDIYPTIEDVFILINKHTPIPKYILDCANLDFAAMNAATMNAATMNAATMNAATAMNATATATAMNATTMNAATTTKNYYRLIIDQFRHCVKREYKPYLSDAMRPRDPNISLDKMCDKIMEDSILLFQYIIDGNDLFHYMKFINNTVWIKFDRDKKGNKIAKKPFYAYVQYILTGENDWTSNVKLIQLYKTTCGEKTTPQEGEKTTPQEGEKTDMKDRKHIPQKIRQDLWEQYYGENYNSLCLICKKKISIINFEVGHIISVADGGTDTIDNLKPICRDCNRSMGTTHMDEYIEKYRKVFFNPDL
jgi:5-methylcytosine-specific restriction endonuclease McrA